LRLRFILDTPIPVSLGYRLLAAGPKIHHRDTELTEVNFHNKATKIAKIRSRLLKAVLLHILLLGVLCVFVVSTISVAFAALLYPTLFCC
jgi:hypothetical protein